MRNMLLVFGCFVIAGTSAPADQWSDPMFSTQKLDFGVIATGSEVVKKVEIRNVHAQPLQISSVRTSCTCAIAKLVDNKYTIEPGGSAFIDVQMDTKRHKQRKDSNLLVTFSSPRFIEHRVPITAYIRTDVVFTPGKVKFDTVEYGKPAQAVVEIAYAGRPDWNIVDIKIDNPNLRAVLSKPERTNGVIRFKLTMNLNEAANIGNLRDVVTIETNDRSNPFIPLRIEGKVAPDISASPSIVRVGAVPTGGTTKRTIVLRGRKPFTVSGVDCASMSGCFKANLRDVPLKTHAITVEFTPPDRPGKFSEELLVSIKGRPAPLRVNITGTIVN